jgi:hypothetical protein
VLSKAAVVEDLVNALAAHRELAQRLAARQRGYLYLVETIVGDQEPPLRPLGRRSGKDEGTLRRAA